MSEEGNNQTETRMITVTNESYAEYLARCTDVRKLNQKLCEQEGHVPGALCHPCLRCHTQIAPDVAEVLREMFFAHSDYGCGFYSDDRWLAAYKKLQKYAGIVWDDLQMKFVLESEKTC